MQHGLGLCPPAAVVRLMKHNGKKESLFIIYIYHHDVLQL